MNMTNGVRAAFALSGLGLVLAMSPGAAAGDGAACAAAKTILTIQGMTCGGCVAAVKVQLKKTDGVTAYQVSLENAEADVTYDPGRTDPNKIAASVSKTGFAASPKDTKEPHLEPWKPVDDMFTACSEGVCGMRGRNAQAVPQPGARPGQLVYCPVSGAVFTVKEASPRADLNGKTLYLCCEACARHFAQNRARVVARRGWTQ